MIALSAVLAVAFVAAAFAVVAERGRERQLAAELAAVRDRHAADQAVREERHAAELKAERAQSARELAAQRDSSERQLAAALADAARARAQVTEAESARARVQAELASSAEQLRTIQDAQARMQESFDALSKRALDSNSDHVLKLTEQVLARAQEASKADLDRRAEAVEQMVKPVKESLTRVDERIALLEKSGEVSAARIAEQMRSVAAGEERLRGETARLATALRAPATRGRWGEKQLQRTLELAGLRPHVDFQEQPVAALPDGVLRPDVAVRLPGDRTVLLDAKVPLEAYLRAVEAADGEREQHLQAHAAQLRAHVESLSRKQYWDAFAGSPEMAVLFLPSDGLLAAALEVDPKLHEDAFARRIVLATPATLLALLLTIAHVWKQESLAENAREIANEGRELHKRISDLSKHLAKLGRALKSALETYNGAVGSFDSRVVPAARRFEDLRAASADVRLEPLLEVEVLPRLPRTPAAEDVPDDAN
jgi:DNA recombination protein RmuC